MLSFHSDSLLKNDKLISRSLRISLYRKPCWSFVRSSIYKLYDNKLLGLIFWNLQISKMVLNFVLGSLWRTLMICLYTWKDCNNYYASCIKLIGIWVLTFEKQITRFDIWNYIFTSFWLYIIYLSWTRQTEYLLRETAIKHRLNFLWIAHEDSIWTVTWGTSDKDGIENIITGAVDDMVKCWRWSVLSLSVCTEFFFNFKVIHGVVPEASYVKFKL